MIWAVVDHDYQDVDEPVRIITTFADRSSAERYTDEHWGYGYIIVPVPLPAD